MADWKKIKAEYITTDTSYRKLAEKYGLDQSTIARRGSEEGWVELRKRKDEKLQAKLADAMIEKQVDRAKRLQTVADKLLNKVEAAVDDLNMAELFTDKQALRQVTAALKDLKDIQMIKSEADMREQEARIKNLQRQADRADDDKDRTITVEIAGGDGSWQT